MSGRRRSRRWLVGAALALVLAPLSLEATSRAEPDAGGADATTTTVLDPADQARRAKVAIKVGARTLTVGELEDRLAAIPPFQMQMFGTNRDTAVRAYAEQIVVRDLLLGAGAEQRALDKELPTSHLLRRALSSATLRRLRAATPSPQGIPMEDVRKYYEDNRSSFDSPERINIWRILCKSKDEAETVLAEAKKDPSIQKYNDLAREHSIDKATNLRGGNLGFIAPDGTSNEAGLKIDPVLIRAIATVKDGEFVPQPVGEGSAFAVVWRRGTVPPNRRSVDDASAQIRAALFRQRTEGAEKKLIDDLRKQNVKEVNEVLLGTIELGAIDAGFSLPRSVPKAKALP